MVAPFSYVLNYFLFGIAGVAVTYSMLIGVFPFRRPPALMWSYFAGKAVVDAYLWYALAHGGAGTWVESFQAIWACVLGIVSLLVIYATFGGSLVTVGICAVFCDIFASMCTSIGLVVANFVFAQPMDSGYIRPFGLWTIVACSVVAICALLARAPMLRLLRWLQHAAQRNLWAWGTAVAGMIAFTVGITLRLTRLVTIDNHMTLIHPLMFSVVVITLVLLLLRARDIARRERAVRECATLVATYNETVGEHRRAVESELSVLEGNGRVLGVLGSKEGDEAREIRRLEQTYQRLRAGTYCDRPALDVVLTASAQRLQAMGVTPDFSVAGVAEGAVVSVTMVLSLLNLASEAAERTGVTPGDIVELRVRGMGNQVVLRLSTPARWGKLWARRFLSFHDIDGTMVVREHTHGANTVVNVMSEGVAS